MAEWIEPIFDRTLSDVEYVKQKIEQGVEYEHPYFTTADNFYLVDSENRKIVVLAWPEFKGAYNASDMNRVNGNMLFLKSLLHELGISITLKTASRVWHMEDVPYPDEFQKYLDDVAIIRSSISQSEETPNVPTMENFNYIKANDIEKILYDTYMALSATESSTYYSGDIYAGEVI